MTAIKDYFIEEQHRAARALGFAEIPAVFGLGVLFGLDAEGRGRVADAVWPCHDSKLPSTLERNRLQNYLRVIELWDAALQQGLAT